jgi:hypothetical protein
MIQGIRKTNNFNCETVCFILQSISVTDDSILKLHKSQ